MTTMQIGRVTLNSYIGGKYSHGIDVGFIDSKNKIEFLQELKETFGYEKILHGSVFEVDQETPLLISSMAFKVAKYLDEKNCDLDFIESVNEKNNDKIHKGLYQVEIYCKDSRGDFDHIINFGIVSYDESCKNKTNQEIVEVIKSDLMARLQKIVKVKDVLGKYKLRISKVKLKNLNALKSSVDKLIF